MYFNVVKDQDAWSCFLDKFEQKNKDIYFSYNYVKSYEKNGDGEARCSIFDGKNGMKIIYPFLITKIPDYGLDVDYFDISSCYGYGGPLIENYNESDLAEYENLFHIWCQNNNIVAEFIRFHPIMNNHTIFKRDILVEKNRNTIFIDIDRSIEDIWNNSINSKNRNQIRKAKKVGIVIRESNSMNDFVEIYTHTMERLNANNYYFFRKEYYEELCKLMPQNMAILEAIFEGNVIASSLFIFMGQNIHYHLSGSLSEYMNFCPNNLMIYYGIKFGINKGLKKLHLGGGTTDTENDTLYKFKSSFSKDSSEFFIGKRIHNKELYHLLIKRWEEKNSRKAKLFLQYNTIN